MQGRGYYHNLTKQIASEELGEYPQGHIARKFFWLFLTPDLCRFSRTCSLSETLCCVAGVLFSRLMGVSTEEDGRRESRTNWELRREALSCAVASGQDRTGRDSPGPSGPLPMSQPLLRAACQAGDPDAATRWRPWLGSWLEWWGEQAGNRQDSRQGDRQFPPSLWWGRAVFQRGSSKSPLLKS